MQKDAKLDYQRMLEAVKDAKTEAMMLEFVDLIKRDGISQVGVYTQTVAQKPL